jgi:hypothetical protein
MKPLRPYPLHTRVTGVLAILFFVVYGFMLAFSFGNTGDVQARQIVVGDLPGQYDSHEFEMP